MDRNRGFKVLLTTLPLLTAWLYLVGIAHHQGYLAAFGVHHSLLPLDLESALVTGFISLFQMSFPALLYVVATVFFLVVALGIVAAISLNRRPRVLLANLRRRLTKKRRPTNLDPAIDKAIGGALTANSFLGGFLSVLLLFGASVLVGTETGKSSARSSMEKFRGDESVGVAVAGARSKIIGCTPDFCVVFDGKQSKQVSRQALNDAVLRLPQGGT